jgi:hypothetical protein
VDDYVPHRVGRRRAHIGAHGTDHRRVSARARPFWFVVGLTLLTILAESFWLAALGLATFDRKQALAERC